MFYILQEDSKSLLELWNDIINGEDIDPYSELNIDLVENYDRFTMPDSDIPLLFIDDEYGLYGCAVLTPLESSNEHPNILGHNTKWILHAVNIYFRKMSCIKLHPKIIDDVKARFYKHLREAVYELLKSESSQGLLVLSEDVNSQDEFQHYTRFVITQEMKDLEKESNIIGIIPDIRLYLNEQYTSKKLENCSSNNVVFLKTAYK